MRGRGGSGPRRPPAGLVAASAPAGIVAAMSPASAGRAAPPLRLWLIDDTADHHATARETIGGMAGVRLTCWLDPVEAIAAYAEAASRPADLPRVVLMDFFLGEMRGDQATRELRRLQPTAAALTIVGYSSMASGSARIVEAGGDVIVRKVRDGSGRNPLLARWLEQFRRTLP